MTKSPNNSINSIKKLFSNRLFITHGSIVLLFTISVVGSAQFHVAADIYIGRNAELHVAVNQMDFNSNVITDRTPGDYGVLSYANQAEWQGANADAKADGFTRIYDKEQFLFPSGDGTAFQPARIQRTEEKTPVDLAFYNQAHSDTDKEFSIYRISEHFYWTVYGSNPAKLSFSWNALSGLQNLVGDQLNRLRIVGYDGEQWRLIESGLDNTNFLDQSAVSTVAGSISSVNPVNLQGYEAYTLGVVTETELPGVSQGFTPNGDGINDTWFIEGIENYPKAKIVVYNRWGSEVFRSVGQYNNDWDARFKKNKEILPEGSYLYLFYPNADNEENIQGWIYITR